MIKQSRNAPLYLLLSILVSISVVSGQSLAQSTTDTVPIPAVEGDETRSTSLIDEAQGDDLTSIERVEKNLQANLPNISFSDITESVIPGLFEIVADGQIYYVDESANHLVDGSLIRLSDRANLTDARLGKIHMGFIDAIDEKDMLIYEPEVASDRSITVFTDITCGYCRRLHAEIDTLLDDGVRVRYLLFPRAGLGSQGHKDLESVWCASNPQEAMTNAKQGGVIEAKTCDNPIESHVKLAERLGLRGTPLIYTDSGEKLAGYRPADVLVGMVNQSKPLAN